MKYGFGVVHSRCRLERLCYNSDMANFQYIRNIETKVRTRVLGYVAAGFGFVAGLAWNDAIKALIDTFFPERGTVLAQFIYAITLTLIVGILISVLSRFMKQQEGSEKQ